MFFPAVIAYIYERSVLGLVPGIESPRPLTLWYFASYSQSGGLALELK